MTEDSEEGEDSEEEVPVSFQEKYAVAEEDEGAEETDKDEGVEETDKDEGVEETDKDEDEYEDIEETDEDEEEEKDRVKVLFDVFYLSFRNLAGFEFTADKNER